MTKKFVWYKPEDWKDLHRWCSILYIDTRNHMIFRKMKDKDTIPEDCVCWTTMNELVKYGIKNSDMKYLLEKEEK